MVEACSLPEKKPRSGSKLQWMPAKDAVSAFFRRTAGKVLVVTDGFLLPVLTAASLSPRAIFLLYDGDALPLFFPEGVGAVVGAGGEGVLRAARRFALLSSVPCLALPSHATLKGALERSGRVKTGETEAEVPLADCLVACDTADMVPSFSAAYGRILLHSLALFERRALAGFGEEDVGGFAFSQEPLDAMSLVAANAVLTLGGGDFGEGNVLAAGCGELAAYRALMRLYGAFFRHGRLLRYAAVDYRKRAKEAGVDYGSLHIPDFEELLKRERLLGRMRPVRLAELDYLRRAESGHFAAIRALKGEIPAALPVPALSTLPERAGGLSAVIRDFGFMECV